MNGLIKIAIIGTMVLVGTIPVFSQTGTMTVLGTDTTYFDVQPDNEEFTILKEFYQQTNGRKWNKNTNWLKGTTSDHFKEWFGVTVENGDVVSIALQNNNLEGEVPSVLYKLSRLSNVSLDGNNLSSPPTELNRGQTEDFMTLMTLQQPVCEILKSGKSLPVWPLGVIGPKDQAVDWRNAPPSVSTISSSSNQQAHRSGGVAINSCGKMQFYLFHKPEDGANKLHIYSSGGTQLTNETIGSPLLALNAVYANSEIQVIQVPGTTDEWYIIYSLYKVSCDAYCPATVVYSRVRHVGSTLTILSREVSISTTTFSHGKAVSADVNGDPSRHYLYLAERTGSSTTRFHRYIIDATGIQSGQQTTTIPANYWNLSIPGSCLELSHDGKYLAFLNKNETPGVTDQDIIIFDVTQFSNSSYTPLTLKVPNLLVTLDLAGQTTTKSIYELYTSYSGTYGCFQYLKRKLSSIEFSPSGRYLYVTGGGYSNTAGNTYQTYLLQIDLLSGGTTPLKNVSIQVQKAVAPVSSCSGISVASAGTAFHPISLLQSAFDGRIYFTKGSQPTLFVIPSPDCLMPQNLTPSEIDLASAPGQNISLNQGSFVAYMPEGIDGYQYQSANPDLNFSLDKTSIMPLDTVTLSISNYDKESTYYRVDWGDGTSQSITSSSPIKHVYSSPAVYNVIVTQLDDRDCLSTREWSVGVAPCGSVLGLDFNATRYICAVKFSSLKMNNCLTSYLWDFGDGQTSAERNPIHAYAGTGTYTVHLNISYNCSSCAGDTTLIKQIVFNNSGSVLEDQVVEVISYQKPQVLSNSVSTFSDSWTLQHEASSLSEKSGYLNGSEGVWRNDASYVFETPRESSSPVSTKTDGTYPLDQFNWEYADLNAVPNWIKANTMTQYSPYSYELENKDVLGVYSSALYDYKGQLPVATGANMRNNEMAFTSFEELPATGQPTGNWILGNQTLPAFNKYTIRSGNKNMAVVEAPLRKLTGVTQADVSVKNRNDKQNKYSNFFPGNEIICSTTHPNTSEWSLVVFKTSPSEERWAGNMQVRNTVSSLVKAKIDNSKFHSGKSSLKVDSVKTFIQNLLKIDSAKSYAVNAWVSVNDPYVTTDVLASNLGFDIIVKRKNGQVVNTFSFPPAGTIIEGWQQIRGQFTCSINDAVIEIKFYPGSLGSAWYDDLRFHPENGNMKSFVYDTKDYRLRAILDEENFASFFYYDAEGNLYLTKKETKDGIKTLTENISYQLER